MPVKPKKEFEPTARDLYIPHISPFVYKFLEKVWFSFVNKVVSLHFSNDEYCFEYSLFEVIQNDFLKISVSSSQFSLKEIADKTQPVSFKKFIQKTRPISLKDPLNGSACAIRRAIIAKTKGEQPEVELIDFTKNPTNVHPKLLAILTKKMKYGVRIPLFIRDTPIGVLWGIREKPISRAKMIEINWQFQSLYEGISNIISHELRHDLDDRMARRGIEKIQPNSRIENILYFRQGPSLPPVKSLFAYSYIYKKKYRMDTSYILPTSNGFAVSLKQYLPEEQNDTGKNILMIPGFFCNRSCFDRLAREMSLHYGYKVFTLDTRGRSKFTLPSKRRYPSWTVDDYITEDFPVALDWIRRNYPNEQTVVFGHSMGGMIPKFYSGSFDAIKQLSKIQSLPDPVENIAGIFCITSPNYIDLKVDFPGFKSIKSLSQILVNNAAGDFMYRLVASSLPKALNTIDLNHFFKIINSISQSSRIFSFNVGNRIPTIKDFVGYREISPPEWYFLLEDVFCEESTKVILQFFRSQVNYDKGFYSFDGRINYTEDLKNVKQPVFAVIGSIDTLAPPESIKYGFSKISSCNKHKINFNQGHLGIIMHPKTVRKISDYANDWIEKL